MSNDVYVKDAMDYTIDDSRIKRDWEKKNYNGYEESHLLMEIKRTSKPGGRSLLHLQAKPKSEM